ncbi:hypothetical protein EXU57_23550 [Segetibacter sp. 3557_3]|nr:hypothetical protein EXU57_23550 [Segetibacter sp. 3557_3]
MMAKSQVPPQYEFRAVWVATVENIDWPSKRGLPTEDQKSEFIKLLDLHQRNGMNAILMQVRPSTDAFYPSAFEPWSEYLTGKQGLAPSPYYDPLQFMIEETHKRGMEFHAWLNPYRAVFNVNKSSVAHNHVTRLNPQWFLNYGTIKIFNPGMPEVREYVNGVIKDVVSRYDLDGIHFDDYFYPYPIAGKTIPDEATYQKYGVGMTRNDWRRSNVDSIIRMVHETIQTANSRIKFGISPFGVWRNKSKDPAGSSTRAGLTNYDDLYADILLWMKNGWIDYVAPQLYWEIGHPLCDYNVLLDWWSGNSFGKQVFVGHGIYRGYEQKSGGWRRPSEIPNQIKELRERPQIQGSVYFSSKSFARNPYGWNDSLRNNYYRLPALVPPMPWIDSIAPIVPLIEKIRGSKQQRIMYRGAEPIKGFALYTVSPGKAVARENATLVKLYVAEKFVDVDLEELQIPKIEKLFIAAVDRNNNVSEWVSLR